METPFLLIADGSEAFRTALADALSGYFQITVCGTGTEALKHLTQNAAELLILDLMLPELDGLSLLQRLKELDIHPVTLATTRLAEDYVVEAAAELGVSYLMLKPCDIRAVVSRIRDLNNRRLLSLPDPQEFQAQVSKTLISLGFSAKHRGYAYLQQAIMRMAENPMQSVTKELYPEVARRFGCGSAQVERSIRSAIQSAWSRGCGSWDRFFFPDESGRIPRPSNAVFISRLADEFRSKKSIRSHK